MWHMVCSCNQNCAEVGVEPVTRIYPIVGISHSVAIEGGRMWKAFLNNFRTIYKSASYFFSKSCCIWAVSLQDERACARTVKRLMACLWPVTQRRNETYHRIIWDSTTWYTQYILRFWTSQIMLFLDFEPVWFSLRQCRDRRGNLMSCRYSGTVERNHTNVYKGDGQGMKSECVCTGSCIVTYLFFWDFSRQNSMCLQGCLQPCSNSENNLRLSSQFWFSSQCRTAMLGFRCLGIMGEVGGHHPCCFQSKWETLFGALESWSRSQMRSRLQAWTYIHRKTNMIPHCRCLRQHAR